MFDFKIGKILMTVFSILLAIGIGILVIVYQVNFILAGLIFLVLEVSLSIFVQKITSKKYQSIRRALIQGLDPDVFKREMADLIERSKKFTPWQMIKEEDYTLALIYSGEFDQAKEQIAHIREHYDLFLMKDLHNQFSLTILECLIALFTKDIEFQGHFTKMTETLEMLPDKVKMPIKANRNSFYNLILLCKQVVDTAQVEPIGTVDDQNPLFKATLLYLLTLYTNERFMDKINNYRLQLSQIEGSLFFLKEE